MKKFSFMFMFFVILINGCGEIDSGKTGGGFQPSFMCAPEKYERYYIKNEGDVLGQKRTFTFNQKKLLTGVDFQKINDEGEISSWKLEYSYDSNNNMIQYSSSYDGPINLVWEEGKLVDIPGFAQFEYEGELLKKITQTDGGGSGEEGRDVEFTYDANNRVIKSQKLYYSDENDDSTTIYEYDSEGRLIKYGESEDDDFYFYQYDVSGFLKEGGSGSRISSKYEVTAKGGCPSKIEILEYEKGEEEPYAKIVITFTDKGTSESFERPGILFETINFPLNFEILWYYGWGKMNYFEKK